MTLTDLRDALATDHGVGTRLDAFDAVDAAAPYGAQLRQVRDAAAVFRADLLGTGQPTSVVTKDLVTLPYPTRFGLWRAALTLSPYLSITNRMLVVRWDDKGVTRTLVFEPSDFELGENTPYFARLNAQTPTLVQDRIVTRHATVLDNLAALGIAPEEVDYLAFDHLHTQDVRRWVGTTRPQPDLPTSEPAFPNAKLVVQRKELDAMADLHPLQLPWYQPETYRDLRPDAIAAIDGDVLLGPGVALIATPGHTFGNQSLVLSTGDGIWAVSEDVIAVECMVPEHSKIPGVARHARTWQREAVLNTNTPEALADQYNSVVKEKSLVDRSQRDSRFPQFLPSSELTPSAYFPGTKPTFVQGSIDHRST
jgi:glyoxylase-like metal-dependent hydrolase (beta-lactamase superfamily II)